MIKKLTNENKDEFLNNSKNKELNFMIETIPTFESYGLKSNCYITDKKELFMGFRTGLRNQNISSLPFFNIQGKICSKDTESFLSKIIILEKKKGTKTIEIKTEQKLSSKTIKKFSIKKDVILYNQDISLSKDIEKIEKQYHKETRRQIRKSSNKITLKEINTITDMELFYNKLRKFHLTKHKSISHIKDFYKAILNNLVPKNMAEINHIMFENKIIGGFMIYKVDKKVILADMFIEKDFNYLKPSYRVLSSLINRFSLEGYTEFSFGPTLKGMKHLMFFKNRWAAKNKEIYLYRIPINGNVRKLISPNSSFKIIRKIIAMLPEIISKRIIKFSVKQYA